MTGSQHERGGAVGNYAKEREAMVVKRIVNDPAHHVVTVKQADGLYRHWRCQKPGSWNMGFDVVTWPGSLCFTGDMGDYLFQRTADMVNFMRSACMSYSYAAEKCVAHDGRLEEWCSELFDEELEWLQQQAKEAADEYGEPERVENCAEKIEEIRQAYSIYETEADAMKALYESGLVDGCDMPRCKTYTWHFLWCLHALKWFFAKIDAGDFVAIELAAAVAE